ncbi:hypothetical protein Trydic_g16038 [Trypoxylus dichotomus]
MRTTSPGQKSLDNSDSKNHGVQQHKSGGRQGFLLGERHEEEGNTKKSGNKNKKPKGRSPKTNCSDEPTPTPGPSNEDMDINTEDAEAIRYTQEWPDTESEKSEEEENDVLTSQTHKEYRPPPIVLREEGKLELIRKESATNNIQLRSRKSTREGIKLFPETAADFRRLRNLLDGKKKNTPHINSHQRTKCANYEKNHHAASRTCAQHSDNIRKKKEVEKVKKVKQTERKPGISYSQVATGRKKQLPPEDPVRKFIALADEIQKLLPTIRQLANPMTQGQRKEHTTICSWNANGIKSNKDELPLFLDQENVDILLVYIGKY